MLKILSTVFLLLLAHAFSERVSAQGMPLVRFQSCYDGDTCTTTNAEKVRLGVSMLLKGRRGLVSGQPECSPLLMTTAWPISRHSI